MRIFFVTNNYTPYAGGVVHSINAISNELRIQGHEVFIITLSFLDKNDTDPDYVIRISCPIKFRYKNNHMAFPYRPAQAMDILIKQYKPDIIHIHHPFLLGACALKAAKKYHIPCVFTHHTLYTHYTHYLPFMGNYSKHLIEIIVTRLCNKVDTIIAPSTYVKQYLESHNIKKPIMVIASPLRDCFENNSVEKIQETSSFFKLLLVTRFVPEKNIPFIFDVMELLPPNFQLTLAGYGNDYEKIQRLVKDKFSFLSHRIEFIHKPDEKQLLILYRTADLFVFPSQTDTQGIVLAESMSQGLPVITLDGPGQRDIIINGKNGFIVNNAQEMACVIKMISDCPNTLKYYSLEAEKTAHLYYANHIVKKIVNLYTAICATFSFNRS